jgi:hypothetical protein
LETIKKQVFLWACFYLKIGGIYFMTTSAVGKKRKKNGFTQISNSMLEDDRLSWRAKGILAYMLSRPNNWKINKTDLYRKATEGRDALDKALGELKETGYLHIYRNILENGKFDGWIWEYDDEPFTPDILKNRITEKQQEIVENVVISRSTENPYYGFPEVRNFSTYNNTDLNNTNNNNNKEKEIKTNKITTSQLKEEFEIIWGLYPRKIGRKKAFDSFQKARKIKKIPYETIENGLYRYIRYLEQQETDEQYIMHGSTWFNQEKWQDEYILTGIKQKAKSPEEYLRQKYSQDGVDDFESHRNRKTVNDYDQSIPDVFQGF